MSAYEQAIEHLRIVSRAMEAAELPATSLILAVASVNAMQAEIARLSGDRDALIDRAEAADAEVARLRDALEDANRYIRVAITPTVATADWTGSTRKDAEVHAAHEHRREVEAQADATIVAQEAEIARLRDALDGMVERCLDSGFPDEWIDDDSSMAMQVTMGGRELAAARAALAVAGGIA